MFDLSLMGRLSFTHASPTKSPLQPGRQFLGIFEEREESEAEKNDRDKDTQMTIFNFGD